MSQNIKETIKHLLNAQQLSVFQIVVFLPFMFQSYDSENYNYTEEKCVFIFISKCLSVILIVRKYIKAV